MGRPYVALPPESSLFVRRRTLESPAAGAGCRRAPNEGETHVNEWARACAFIGVLAISVSACIPFGGEPLPPIAMEGPAEGPSVLYQLCSDERVRRVAVQRVDSSKGGTVTGPVLWDVRSADGSELERYVVGTTPPGFTPAVVLNGPLPEDELLVVLLETTRFESSADVRLSDIQPGRLLLHGENIDEAEFEVQRAAC